VKFNTNRREILAGAAVGIPAALGLHFISSKYNKKAPYPLLPPGAVTPEKFAANCIRCYACVNACPSGILTVPFPENGNIVEWFEPKMDPNKGPCEQTCNRCTQVCPTGAIQYLSPEMKQKCQIGIAKVKRDACIAWADNEYCMVCDEYCPYNAIKSDESPKGIPRPVVNKDLCRGCGACQNQCPAKKKGKAIFVKGVKEQILLS
jgi:ferredoxin